VKSIPEIIELAISSTDILPIAMLHCKVLADGLGHDPFKEWITREVNGYDNLREAPEYRRIRGKLGGNFERYLIDVNYDHVPEQILGPELHTLVETVTLPQPVGAIGAYADDGTLGFPVRMEKELLELINPQFGSRGRFNSIWVTCPTGSIRPVLITIQHRLVAFLSEMNQLFPTPTRLTNPTSAEIASLDRSFVRYFSVGHADNVIVSPFYVHIDQSSNVFQQIQVSNWPQLEDFLLKQNISPERRDEAKKILDEINSGDESDETQQQLKEWVGNAAEEMAGGVGEVLKETTRKVASDTLLMGLKKYAPKIAKWGWVVAQTLLS
jgi:hypothetical protein